MSLRLSPLKAIPKLLPHQSSKPRVLGALLSVASPKSWVPIVGTNPLLLRKKLQFVSSLLIVGHHGEDGIFGKIVSPLSLLTLLWFTSCLPDVKRLPAFMFLFPPEEIVLYIAVDLTC